MSEECDDGNTNSGDGCSSCCSNETDLDENPDFVYICDKPGQPCIKSQCGNGRIDGPKEKCDDGNSNNYDWCTNNCLLNPACIGKTTCNTSG